MKSKILQWSGFALILMVGIIHLYMFPEESAEAPYMGYLFIANFLIAVIAAAGIRRQETWGWMLGLCLAAGSIYGYLLSRTVGLPGMGVEEWLYPLGVLSLVFEAGFITLALVKKPWGSLTDTHRYALAVVYLSAVVLFGIFGYLGSVSPKNPGMAQMPNAKLISAKTLEEQYGVQVKLVGLSMMGSIVDFRLNVTDAEKAHKLLDDPDRMPMLVVENSGTALIAPMGHRHQTILKDGRNFYMFFPNTNSVVQSGTPITVMFGDLRLEPVLAQ